MFHAERTGLTQREVAQNLRAIVEVKSFRDYEFHGSIYGYSINSSKIGGRKPSKEGEISDVVKYYTLGEMSELVKAVLDNVDKVGSIQEVNFNLRATGEILRGIGFDPTLFGEGFGIPLVFNVKNSSLGTKYIMGADSGVERSTIESKGLDYEDYRVKLLQWYSSLSENLKIILPHRLKVTSSELEKITK